MTAKTYPVDIAPDAVAVRAHLRTIIESPAFRGSKRSQEFLQFIVEHALNRNFDDLKERTLGVEIFGRPPSYDTGDDAIVRVTACDVRKRLSHFYTEFAGASTCRLELPIGSYIPEFKQAPPRQDVPVRPEQRPAAVAGVLKTPSEPERITAKTPVTAREAWPRVAALAAGIALIAVGVWAWNEKHPVEAGDSPLRSLPWASLVQPGKFTHIVFCDSEIVMVQRLLDYSVTLSDYANQRYWPAEMKPEVKRVFQTISFRGSSVAAVDAAGALEIENLLSSSRRLSLKTHTARSLRLSDFKSEDSFILFGSPRSNPWVDLFQGQLDFSFEFDPVRKSEFVRNRHPLAGEPASYIPTAEGFGTGNAYGIIALVSNPDQKGKVLILAGSNAEATEAAAKLVIDIEALSSTLKAHGIDTRSASTNFEILIRVSTMAGSSNTFAVVACRPLGNRPESRT